MTRDHRLLVHQNGTGATLATIAGPFRTGEIEMIPQHFKQGGARLYGQSVRLPVYVQCQLGLECHNHPFT